MKTVLVTGANGQLAKSIKDRIKHYKQFSFVFKDTLQLDITDNESVNESFGSVKFDYCINCAAYTAVDLAEQNIEKATKVNILGPKNLARACLLSKTILIHISTDYVFDSNNLSPLTETDPVNPINIYGKSKLKGEEEVINILNRHYIIRTSWLYSEYGNNFLKTIIKLSKSKDLINVVDDQIGNPTYAGDLAETILNIIDSEKDSFGIYHYTNTGGISWYNFAKEILVRTGKSTKIKAIKTKDYPTLAKRPNFSVLDTSKLHKTFGIGQRNWKSSLDIAIKRYQIKEYVDIAVKASLDAGRAIMEVYNSPFEVDYKEDASPLTNADIKANTIINTYLKATGIPIISEENKNTDYETRKKWAKCWIVDPVDGTKEFIKRNGEFTVNIALVEGSQPIVGIIYAPATKTIYVGDTTTKRAYKINLRTHHSRTEDIIAKGKALEPSRLNSSKIRVAGSRSHMNPETLNYLNKLKLKGHDVEVVSKGSSLKFCLLAEGTAEVYPRFAPTMEWDTAAGHAICNAVGIEVISKETNKPLQYNKENLLNPSFIAIRHSNDKI